jgi:hypothetical protein
MIWRAKVRFHGSQTGCLPTILIFCPKIMKIVKVLSTLTGIAAMAEDNVVVPVARVGYSCFYAAYLVGLFEITAPFPRWNILFTSPKLSVHLTMPNILK